MLELEDMRRRAVGHDNKGGTNESNIAASLDGLSRPKDHSSISRVFLQFAAALVLIGGLYFYVEVYNNSGK